MLAAIDHRFAPANLGRFTDVLRLRDGRPFTVRFVRLDDGQALSSYFKSLSQRSRYSRLMGAASELPASELEKTLHVGEGSRFAVVAELKVNGFDTIVGEARYSYDAATQTAEFGLSIDDAWQGYGIGAALLANLECRTAALGAVRLMGETLRNNEQMIGLALKAGYAFTPTATDWRQVRFEKPLHHAEQIPCESWKLVASANGSRARAALTAR